MSEQSGLAVDIDKAGLFNTQYVAFLETIRHLRPQLHRYCSRMTGSVLDGEDVMQEAVFEAYSKLDQFQEGRPLSPWLFKIAHNRCVDFLRRRAVRLRVEAEAASFERDSIPPVEPLRPALSHAIEHLVINLPPKERACVLLKDVFDCSLEETAQLVGSTVGGVKAALNRGRGKLEALEGTPGTKPIDSPELLDLLRRYVELFNRQDWDGVRELTSADARLRVAECFAGRLADSPYFIEYEHPIISWRMAVGYVDGEAAVIIQRDDADGLMPFSVVRLGVADGQIVSITDYIKSPWVLGAAASVGVEKSSPRAPGAGAAIT